MKSEASILRKLLTGIVLLAIATVLFDTLLEQLLHLLHTSFELLEFILDTLVEHIFKTDRYTSQLIAFYLMMLAAAVVVYKAGKRLLGSYRKMKNSLFEARIGLKNKVRKYWQTMRLIDKIQWGSVWVVSGCLLLWGLFS
ncbi:hypothetical protein Q9L42_013025 [Methylomarinum sp. Ch1-1]|uniref:Uncharacterized protein n=1 Tax=Methylomarinum roseum TaxID=3067653 RepID=A0AAU7NQN0_9GAMM|nr:hypothetical protein [Methylomarinum sp. Ch1-1]MDP4520758.1 hypothetical protein [Methylomarinum sp. Ch1-1]